MAEVQTMNAKDVVSAKEGRAFITIEGKRYNFFNIKNLKITTDKETEKINILGERVEQTKSVGAKISGSMTAYNVTNYFDEYMDRFINHGKDFYFDIQAINEDATSDTGARTTIYRNCCMTKHSEVVFDVDGKYLELDMDFMVGGVKRPQRFKDLDGIHA